MRTVPKSAIPSFIYIIYGLLTLAATPALAEIFVDIYGGVSQSEDAQVDVHISGPFCLGPFFGCQPSGASAARTVGFDPSFDLGVRAGYWFEHLPWVGLALDLSSFHADGEAVETGVSPFSVLLMLRWPILTSVEFPKGQFQPYVGIGPGIFTTNMSADFTPDVPRKVDGKSPADIGLDFRSGLAWFFHPRFGLFAEYRFTRFAPETGTEAPLFCLSCPSGTIETKLQTDHFLAGVSLRF